MAAKKIWAVSILLVLAALGLAAQTRELNDGWLWASGAGGAGEDEAWSVCADASGNLYVTGFFSGVATFGPYSLTATSGTDCFIARMSASGEWLWAINFFGTGNERGNCISVDALGFIYVTGAFDGQIQFPNGPPTNTHGGSDAFVAKFDPYGACMWWVQVGGFGYETGTGIAVDGQGNAYATGHFEGEAYFSSVYDFQSRASQGESDLYELKVGEWGWVDWISTAGGPNDDISNGIVVDQAGNSYVAGNFWGNPAFGTQTLANTGWWDAFAAKLSPAGTWLWARHSVGSGSEWCNGTAIDASRNIHIAGGFDLDTGCGATNLIHQGASYQDVFAAKLDSAGNWIWASGGGGISADWAYGIAADASGKVDLTGFCDSANATIGDTTLACLGAADVFAAKLDPQGNWQWTAQAGGADNEWSHSVCVDANGKVYLAGNFQTTAGFGANVLSTNGVYDIFIAKLEGTIQAPGIPLAPQNLSVSLHHGFPLQVDLAWDAVTQDTNGDPVTPTYTLYQSADPYGGWTLLGTTAATAYTCFLFEISPAWFYYVSAEAPGR